MTGHLARGGALLLALVLALVPLAACGDQPASETLPDCSDVWVDGRTLPEDYEGCMEDGTIQVSETKKCSATEGSFVTFDEKHFAILGQEVSDAGVSSTEYQEAAQACFPGGW
ncbi:MAG TPA: hypothetical protein VI589_09755 [Vicinamibacteria bacterium]